jgi:hypothetical protein
LSPVNWVKRQWRDLRGREGFPSTPSIASRSFRRDVLRRLADDAVARVVSQLRDGARRIDRRVEAAIADLGGPDSELGEWLRTEAGPWVYPDWWQAERLARDSGKPADEIRDVVENGRASARQLLKVMSSPERNVLPPTDYLAIVMQDLDNMGAFLAGAGTDRSGRPIPVVDAAEHQAVSRQLGQLAVAQQNALKESALLGVPVYAGGDDLLAFVPAATALDAAQTCHDLVPAGLPTASTALLFFHYQSSLQSALGEARHLLETAKLSVPGKHALAVGYQRRSGASEVTIQPWVCSDGSSTAAALGVFAGDHEHRLSPGLVTDIERDRGELGRLAARNRNLYRAELSRLVARHISGKGPSKAAAAAEASRVLELLGRSEAVPAHTGDADSEPSHERPERAARVAVFLRQEAR